MTTWNRTNKTHREGLSCEYLDGLIKGDAIAWHRFIEEYAPFVHSIVRRTLSEKASGGWTSDDREDLVQDVFLRLIKDDFRLIRQFKPERAGFSTWLALITRCTVLNFIVTAKRRISQSYPDFPTVTNATFDVHESLFQEIPGRILARHERQLLTMFFVDGLSAEDISKALGICIQTVYNRKCRIISKLRTFFK